MDPYAARHMPMGLPPSQPSIASGPPMYHHPLPPPPPPPPGAAAGDPYDFHHHHYMAVPPNPETLVRPEQQNIKTLFVSGLPDDVKPREIHNLFRRRHGFESCQLKYTGRGDQVVAFATFFNHQAAMAALLELNGATFDPETGAILHIELARSNSRTKQSRGGGAYVVIDKRVKSANEAEENTWSDGDGGSDDLSGTDDNNSSEKSATTAAQRGKAAKDLDFAQVTSNEQSEKTIGGDMPPCSTLFIANLGPNCTEEELKQVLSQYSGFKALKMRGKFGMPVAFADFMDVESSTEALNGLKGSVLPSSDRGGMHLEYARSKMRKG
ncbi:hypothetical protein QJS10_CPB18g00933 [Acorus calamus]|uniref:RRM domain-containing protein n=1 Tax=Acorus calamus TaxID=4465 RepID=A0AAV9CPT9_ACOCL|nr:hypothetical protein QJS10_CPB18g00933 [Acorus calamus]